jgi:hypothetical protein
VTDLDALIRALRGRGLVNLLCLEAADALEALLAENERLRKAWDYAEYESGVLRAERDAALAREAALREAAASNLLPVAP